MKQFIKNRIKEIETKLTEERNVLFTMDFKQESVKERAKTNQEIRSLERVLNLNRGILSNKIKD